MSRRLSFLAPTLVLVSVAAFVSCSSGDTPTAPAPPPSPIATPTPAIEQPARVTGCGVGPSTFNENCPRTSPTFLGDVDAAINRVVAKNPSLFNTNDARGNGGYLILNPDRFYQLVQEELQTAGFCTTADSGEVAVKKTNAFSDQYRIMLSSQHIRRGDTSYRATCYPAWF